MMSARKAVTAAALTAIAVAGMFSMDGNTSAHADTGTGGSLPRPQADEWIFRMPASSAHSDAQRYIPHVNLSPDAPGVIHGPDGVMTVRFLSVAIPPQVAGFGFCEGTFFNPSIVSLGTNGTSVHFGVKYFCSEPVDWALNVGVWNWYEDTPGGPLVNHLGGYVSRGGVDQQPTVDTVSFPCVNNLNSGWQPFTDGVVRGQSQSMTGNTVTVGCRVAP